MPVFSNEEEEKRRKIVKAPADAYEKSMSRTPAPLRPVIRAATGAYDEASRVAKEGFRDAASRPTAISRSARGLGTGLAMIPAALYGASKDTIKRAKGLAAGAGEFYTELKGGDSTSPASPAKSAARVTVPAARVPTPDSLSRTAPGVPGVGTSGAAPLDILKSKYGEDSGTPGTGYISSSTGTVRMGQDGKAIMVGSPVGDSTRLPTNAQEPERRRPTRMVTYGGYRIPDRTETQPDPEIRRVSDIPPPATFGDIPGYNKQVRAAQADAATEKFEAGQVQQQDQFEQGQSQAAAIAMQRQAQQQDQFEQNRALDERRVAGTEQQQQLAADQQEAKLAAEQRREGRTVAKEDEISAARARFEAADTPSEKVAAAQMLNSLQGMKIDTPTKGKPPGLTPKETSQQIQGALKAFESAGGEAAAGTDFYTWMRQNDTRGYQAAFGNLTPKDIRVNARINELTDEQLMSSDMAGAMNPGETPAQFRQRLALEYQSKRGY